jgi:hypothetical protein
LRCILLIQKKPATECKPIRSITVISLDGRKMATARHCAKPENIVKLAALTNPNYEHNQIVPVGHDVIDARRSFHRARRFPA